jgi:hypothetical protein
MTTWTTVPWDLFDTVSGNSVRLTKSLLVILAVRIASKTSMNIAA